MKGIIVVIFIILAILFFTTSKVKIEQKDSQGIEGPKKTYIDIPINTHEERIEALNIANTIQPSYLNSRIDARGDAKESVQQANKQMESREKALEDFTKP